MGRPAGWMKELTGRSPMKVPGQASHRRDMERAFWRRISEGLSSVDAAHAVGVSTAAGVRWFASVAGWRRSCSTRSRANICALRSARRSRCCARRALGCRRSPGSWIVRRRRSRGSCGATRRHARVPRIGRAVEGRAGRAPAEDRQAGRQRRSARVRAAAPRRRGSTARRDCGGPGDAAVEGPQQAAAPGSPVGDSVKPGTDLKPAEGRFP
jgi:hypothetical protein